MPPLNISIDRLKTTVDGVVDYFDSEVTIPEEVQQAVDDIEFSRSIAGYNLSNATVAIQEEYEELEIDFNDMKMQWVNADLEFMLISNPSPDDQRKQHENNVELYQNAKDYIFGSIKNLQLAIFETINWSWQVSTFIEQMNLSPQHPRFDDQQNARMEWQQALQWLHALDEDVSQFESQLMDATEWLRRETGLDP